MPVTSLKATRLLNKQWGFVAVKVLWDTFKTNLDDKGEKCFDALLSSSPGGALDNLRGINLQSGCASSTLENHLTQLLCVLPRDRIRDFSSVTLIPGRILGILLKSQTQLRRLAVRYVPLPTNYLTGNLQKLTSLNIVLPRNSNTYKSWLENAPTLKELVLRTSGGSDKLGARALPQENALLKLDSLNMEYLRLGSESNSVADLTCLVVLKSLRINSFHGLEHFLDQLAKDISNCKDTALKSLVIEQPYDTNSLKEYLDSLLRVVTGLETLIIAAKNIDLPSMEIMCCQGRTLRYLHIDHNADYLFAERQREDGEIRNYSNEELARLFDQCPNVEELAIDALPINFNNYPTFDIFSFPERRTSKEKDLIRILVRSDNN